MRNILTILSTVSLFTLARSGNQPSAGYGAPQGGSSYGAPKGGEDYSHDLTYIKDNFYMHPLILQDANDNFFQIAMMKTLRKKKKKPSKFDFDENYFSNCDFHRLNFLRKRDNYDSKNTLNDTKNGSESDQTRTKLLKETKSEESKIQKRSNNKSNKPYLRIYSKEANPYEFGYKVKDDYSGSKFHQQEASDGNQVRGEYRVELPDGRTQIVTYWADWQTGFHADVKYEGKATYPPNPPKYGPPTGGGNGGYNYPAPSAPGNTYGAP